MGKLNLDKALKAAELATKLGILGYSENINKGILTAVLKAIEKDACYTFINEDRRLFETWTEERWMTLRNVSRTLHI